MSLLLRRHRPQLASGLSRGSAQLQVLSKRELLLSVPVSGWMASLLILWAEL